MVQKKVGTLIRTSLERGPGLDNDGCVCYSEKAKHG